MKSGLGCLPHLAKLPYASRLTLQVSTVLQGLFQLHSHRPVILHRDLKSPNLLVDKHWRVKVGDFDLSRVAEGDATASNLTANNPRWLAPEVITSQVGHSA